MQILHHQPYPTPLAILGVACGIVSLKKLRSSLNPLVPVNMILFGKSLCQCNQVKVRLYGSRVGPKPVTGVLIKEGKFGYKNIDTQGRWPYEHRGRVVATLPPSNEHPRLLTTTETWKGGRLGGSVLERPPLAQGVIPESRDGVPRRAPCRGLLLLPLPMSLPLFLGLS